MWDLSSPTRDWTCGPGFGMQSLNHRTTREFFNSIFMLSQMIRLTLSPRTWPQWCDPWTLCIECYWKSSGLARTGETSGHVLRTCLLTAPELSTHSPLIRCPLPCPASTQTWKPAPLVCPKPLREGICVCCSCPWSLETQMLFVFDCGRMLSWSGFSRETEAIGHKQKHRRRVSLRDWLAQL